MTLSIQLPENVERRLREMAQRLAVPLDQLVAAALRDLMAQAAQHFDAAARCVVSKNGELHRRLAQ